MKEAIDKLYSPSRQTFQLSQGIAADQSLFNYSFSAVKQLSKTASTPSTTSPSVPSPKSSVSSSSNSLPSPQSSAAFDGFVSETADDKIDRSLDILHARDGKEMNFSAQCDAWRSGTNTTREIIVEENYEDK